MKAHWWVVVLIAFGGVVRAEETVTISPANLKENYKEREVEVVGQLVGMLPDRTQNKWVFVVRVDGTVPGDRFHSEKKGSADVYVELRTESDDRKLLQMWATYQNETRAAAARKQPAPVPPEVKVDGAGKQFREGVAFHNLPRLSIAESDLKASLTEARLGR